MSPTFIEFTSNNGDKPVLINRDSIFAICPNPDCTYIRLYLDDATYIEVKESYEEVIHKLSYAGATMIRK